MNKPSLLLYRRRNAAALCSPGGCRMVARYDWRSEYQVMLVSSACSPTMDTLRAGRDFAIALTVLTLAGRFHQSTWAAQVLCFLCYLDLELSCPTSVTCCSLSDLHVVTRGSAEEVAQCSDDLVSMPSPAINYDPFCTPRTLR